MLIFAIWLNSIICAKNTLEQHLTPFSFRKKIIYQKNTFILFYIKFQVSFSQQILTSRLGIWVFI